MPDRSRRSSRTAVREPMRAARRTRSREPSRNDATRENSLALLRIRASRWRPSPIPRRSRTPSTTGPAAVFASTARVVATVRETVVRMVSVALVVTGARGVESTTEDTVRVTGRVDCLDLVTVAFEVVAFTSWWTRRTTSRTGVACALPGAGPCSGLHLGPDLVDQGVVGSAVGLGDTCHQGPPDGDEAAEHQHGSQRAPRRPPVGGRRAHRDLAHASRIPALVGHKRRNGQISSMGHRSTKGDQGPTRRPVSRSG